MDTRYMEYVIKLAQTGSMSQAAKQLYISQPTLSQFIRNYADSTGINLFRRANGRYVPTPAGETFLRYANQIVTLETEMEQALRKYTDTVTLRVGTSTSKAISLVANVFPKYHEQFSGIEISLADFSASAIGTKILNNDLDIAFSTIYSEGMYNGQVIPLKKEKIILAVPGRLPVCRNANHNYLNFMDLETFSSVLRDTPFILQNPGSCIRHIEDLLFQQLCATPTVILNTSNASSIVDFVAYGSGVGFIPASSMVLNPNIVYFLLDPPLYRIHCIIYRKHIEEELPIRAFFTMAKEYVDAKWTNMLPEVGNLIQAGS